MVLTVTGSCPPPSEVDVITDTASCQYDGDCLGDEKCCQSEESSFSGCAVPIQDFPGFPAPCLCCTRLCLELV